MESDITTSDEWLEEVLEAAVSAKPLLLGRIPPELRTPRVCEAAVRVNPEAIWLVPCCSLNREIVRLIARLGRASDIFDNIPIYNSCAFEEASDRGAFPIMIKPEEDYRRL